MSHPVVTLFQHRAEMLDMQGSKAGTDEALVQLASWIDLERDKLSEDDLAVLVGVGAMLYRDGLARRVTG